MEHENNDLRFLNSQYSQRIRVLERDQDAKRERIEGLLEKNLQASEHAFSCMRACCVSCWPCLSLNSTYY